MPRSLFSSIVIFTDGASSGNPGPGGWAAIIATPDGRVTELGASDPETTNNRMEMMAAIEALNLVGRFEKAGRIEVYTDSTYVIRGITQWIWSWRKNGWKSSAGDDVSNQDLWKKLSAAIARLKPAFSVQWNYVRGHTGIPGNERADQLAVQFSKGGSPRLFQGKLLAYDVPIHDLPEEPAALPELRPKSSTGKAAPFSYVSVVNGQVARHGTWPECEARVKGRPGAKFKKAMSAREEAEIITSWGYDPDEMS